jgi:transcriptional antiterminator Rof (Rho-off)
LTIRINLDCLNQLAIILEWSSGIVYETQTAGIACRDGRAEGVLIPIAGHTLEEDILQYIYKKYNEHCWDLDVADADHIDFAFQKNYDTKYFTVNRDKLKESREAWIHITIQYPSDYKWPLFKGVSANQAILTWKNSD